MSVKATRERRRSSRDSTLLGTQRVCTETSIAYRNQERESSGAGFIFFLKRLQQNSKREGLVRRKDQEITDKDVLESLLEKAMVCRIGLSDNNVPYIVPVCFGYADECIYVHSSSRGKKIDIIRRNDQVCFEIDVDVELVRGTRPATARSHTTASSDSERQLLLRTTKRRSMLSTSSQLITSVKTTTTIPNPW